MIEAQASGLPCLISDKVPIECKKTELVQQISLFQSTIEWANLAIEATKTHRRNMYDDIVVSDFDIEKNANNLQRFYVDAHLGKENLCLY